MSINGDKFAELQRRLRAVKPKYPVWPKDYSGESFRIGQVWTPAALGEYRAREEEEEWPSWEWLIVEMVGENLANACPIFIWTELAGPDDLFVPEEWAGASLVVSFELESTIDRNAVRSCCGRLPRRALEYIAEARSDFRHFDRRGKHNWGFAYLDSFDRRLAYHNAIAEQIEVLQASVRETVYSGDELGAAELPPPTRIIPFLKKVVGDSLPALEPLPAAADSGEGQSYVLLVSQPVASQEPPMSLEPPAPQQFVAECLRFEPLLPNMREPPVLEWKISAPVPSGARAFVFHAPRQRPETFLGEAGLDRGRDGAILITLTQIDTPALKKAVAAPRELLIVLASEEAGQP